MTHVHRFVLRLEHLRLPELHFQPSSHGALGEKSPEKIVGGDFQLFSKRVELPPNSLAKGE